MRYAGICYDGPNEGKHYVWHLPEFNIATAPALYIVNPYDELDEVEQITHVGTYRWSEPLKKWVWLG